MNMKNLIVALLVISLNSFGSGFFGGSTGGGGGPDTTSIARDGSRPPTADQPWNSKKITGLADPTLAQDAATKNYVDSHSSSTVVTVTTNDATPTAIATIPVAANSIFGAQPRCTAITATDSDHGIFIFSGAVHRAGAGASLAGSVIYANQTASDATWAATLIASGNNAVIQVTGAVGKTVNWSCVY